MKGFKTNLTSSLFGIRNALGVPALLLFSAMTGFGSLAQEQGLSLWISMLSTVLIWGMPGQVVHVELYGLGAPLIAVALGVAGANARFLPMTLSMMPLLRKAPHHRRWNYLLVHMISINTWAERMRKGDEIPVERRVAYFLGFSSTCMFAGVLGVIQGYLLLENMPKLVSLCLLFLVPIYFALIMSNTTYPPCLLACALGCLSGPIFHQWTPEWGVGISGTIAGTTAFLLRNHIPFAKSGKGTFG